MKGLQIVGVGETRVIDLPEPTLGPGEVLLEIEKVGFCGSDLSTFLGKNPLVVFPRIPGHEIAAVIESVGPDVPDHIRKGDAATVVPYTSCGHCTSCARGNTNSCRYNQTLGIQRDGAIVEFLAVPWQKLVPAGGLSQLQLVLVEPLSVGFHAVDRAAVTDIDTVAVFGCGMIGIGALVRARLRGATVIAVDVDDEKLALAKTLGCDHGVNARTQNLHESLSVLTGDSGPDVVVEAVGNPATYRSAIEEAAFSARVICIGYAKEDALLPTHRIVQKELSVRGSRNAGAMDFIAVRNFLSKTELPIESLISRQVGLEEAQESLEDWAAAPGKITKLVAALHVG
jgi:threonine dehydrogenase-like Zn-dependent dehydrogenase